MKSAASLLVLSVLAVAAMPKGASCAFRAPQKEVREEVKGFLWVEAESFADYGGWKLDTQFVQKMGSAYLIASGVLAPKAPAKTKVPIPSAGVWRAWVRTKDWLPEFSPGAFALEVGGRRSGRLGVSKREGWRWERAGDFNLGKGEAELALVDLAGAYARCDAVLLTTDPRYVPPDGGKELAAARRRFSGIDSKIADGGSYDVVVVGAGPGGLSAALAASRLGLRTALVHDRPVPGGNASVENRVSFGGSAYCDQQGAADAREGGILEEAMMLRQHLADVRGSAHIGDAFRALVDAETNLTERTNERVIAATKNGRRVTDVLSVDTLTGRRTRYRGRIFVDGTGDGWLGYFVGASRMFGRESRSEYGEEEAPDVADGVTMSGCLGNYRYRRTSGETDYETPVWAKVLPDGFNRADVGGLEARWWLEHPGDIDDVADPERARDELIRISFDYWGWLRRHPRLGAQARKCVLEEVPINNRRREGWRLVGDYVLTGNDCREGRIFSDAVAVGGWGLDLHDPQGVKNPKGNGWWSNHQVPLYTIPYRCLYSKDFDNLLMAGRNISVTHVALGTTRIQGTIFALGQAVGTAAALMVQSGCTAREIGQKRMRQLQQRLLRDDQFIRGVRNEDPHDMARTAKVSASSVQKMRVVDRDDPDFIWNWTFWGWFNELWIDVAAAFPRGDLDRLEKVECFISNGTAKERELTLSVYESDALAAADSTRFRIGQARATVKPGRRFVEFAFEKPLALTRKFVWLEMPKTDGFIWYSRKHILSEGGAVGCRVKPGELKLNTYSQMAFVTAPRLKTGIDARPEYVIDGFSRPDQMPKEGLSTHSWRSDPGQPLPQWVQLDFPKPVPAKEVRIVFDTGLFATMVTPHPKELVKDYEVQGLVDGKWRTLAAVKGNWRRLAVHGFAPARISSLRVRVDATWGVPESRIQEIRVY